MNLLNPQMRALASFTFKEQDRFRELLLSGNAEILKNTGEWIDVPNPNGKESDGCVLRLKLKIGSWYYVEFKKDSRWHQDSGLYKKESVGWSSKGGGTVVIETNCSDIVTFRPASPSEIESVKPTPDYVDYEIKWEKEGGYININGNPLRVTKRPIGHISDKCVLSCYVMDNGMTSIPPFVFSVDKKEIVKKATHARFVRMGGK